MAILMLVVLSVLAQGCAPETVAPVEPSPQAGFPPDLELTAVVQATRIVAEARATAIVLQAQKEAEAVLSQAQTGPETSTSSPPPTPLPSQSDETAPDAFAPRQTSAAPETENTAEPADPIGEEQVEIVGVEIAANGAYIMVRYKADPHLAETWYQGQMFVVCEETGITYQDIPIVPKIGPLIGKPKQAGQLGYVMLLNNQPQLASGNHVTVILGNFQQYSVPVK